MHDEYGDGTGTCVRITKWQLCTTQYNNQASIDYVDARILCTKDREQKRSSDINGKINHIAVNFRYQTLTRISIDCCQGLPRKWTFASLRKIRSS